MSLRRKLEGLENANTPIRIGLVGAGQMGRGFISQVAGIPGMEITAAADMDVQRALSAFRETGSDPIEGLNGQPGRPAVTADALEIARSGAVDARGRRPGRLRGHPQR